MNRTLKEISKEIGISTSYLSEILRGKKGCPYWLMKTILKYYPNLKETDFRLLNPRYILRGEDNET
jgi:hypothetical protein